MFPDDASRNRWTTIADQMGGKSSSQCFQHWFRVLDPSIKKGPWTEDEEELLLQLVRQCEESFHRTPWATIASKIPGRTDTQCRYHYNTVVRSQQVDWSKEEERVLMMLIRSCEGVRVEWVNIAKDLYNELTRNKQTQFKSPPRSALDCKLRVLSLLSEKMS